MARPKKPKTDPKAPGAKAAKKAADAAPIPGGNRQFNTKLTRGFVNRIENLQADIATIMATAMNECKAVHADIKEVYQEAQDEAGLPKKELKRVIKARALERKVAEIREELEGEEQDNFDLIRQALGDLADLPLGGAVEVRQGGKRKTMAEAMREPGAPLEPKKTNVTDFPAPKGEAAE